MLALLVLHSDGRPATKKEVKIEGPGGREIKGETDYDGRFFFDYDDYWINVVHVEKQAVRRDISLGSLKEVVTVHLPPEDLRKGSLEMQAPGIERKLTLKYPDGRPVSLQEVVLYDQRGGDLVLRTDYDGRVFFRWPDDWIARVEIDKMPVKADWKIAGFLSPQRDLELTVPRPTDLTEVDRQELAKAGLGLSEHGIRGQLFYHDGTAVRASFEVQVDVGGQAYSSRSPGRSYCQEDGQFFIAVAQIHRGQKVRGIWIDRDAVPSSRWIRTNEGLYVVLIPQGGLRGGGDRGGVIAGQVVTSGGSPLPGAKLQADVISRGALGLVNPQASARADQEGKFIMIFIGGSALTNLIVDGDTPAEVRLGEGKEAQQLSPRQLRAGLFGLTIVRR